MYYDVNLFVPYKSILIGPLMSTYSDILWTYKCDECMIASIIVY